MMHEKKIIETNAFRKQIDKLPAQEKTLALKTIGKYYLLHKKKHAKEDVILYM